MIPTITITQAVSPGYIYTVTANAEAIVKDTETDKLLCRANKGSQGMFIAIGGTVTMITTDGAAVITQTSTVSGGARFEVQQTRPTTGEEGVIYLIPITSSADEENEYEEWIWVKGEWERLGTTGVNLSNYATLTDANTYSGNNTFNGLLLKKTSASLGDTSVLNRNEADARYGCLAADNKWTETQTIGDDIVLSAIHGGISALYMHVGELSTPRLTTGPNKIDFNPGGPITLTSSDGISIVSGTSGSDPIEIGPSRIRAFPLDSILGTYALDITPESCQLFGIDFNYGDVWSSYFMHPATAPVFSPLDTVKIMKPAISVASTGIAALDFDYANKVLFRTFPNDGGTAIFEFQAGHWKDDSHSGIVSGVVDLRKGSMPIIENLHQHSLVNKDELLRLAPITIDEPNCSMTIGPNATTKGYYSALCINAHRNLHSARAGSYSVGLGVNTDVSDQGIGVGVNTVVGTSGIGIGTWATASYDATALGYMVVADDMSVAVGSKAASSKCGVAIGYCAAANIGELNITAGGGYGSAQTGARCSMLLYGGTSYDDRDSSGYLKFEIGNSVYNERQHPNSENDTVTISKPNLWSALDRAKYRGAQPYTCYNSAEASGMPSLQPNSIAHIYTSADEAIDLSGITLAQHDASVTTAELWVEVTSAGTTIAWPDGMLWPDEVDPTTAPSFSGPAASTEAGYTTQRLYCVTLRTQPIVNIATGSADTPLLIATVAYTLDHKVTSASS